MPSKSGSRRSAAPHSTRCHLGNPGANTQPGHPPLRSGKAHHLAAVRCLGSWQQRTQKARLGIPGFKASLLYRARVEA